MGHNQGLPSLPRMLSLSVVAFMLLLISFFIASESTYSIGIYDVFINVVTPWIIPSIALLSTRTLWDGPMEGNSDSSSINKEYSDLNIHYGKE